MKYFPEQIENAVDLDERLWQEESMPENNSGFEMDMDLPHKNDEHFPGIMFGFALIKDFVLDPLVLVLTLIFFPLGWAFGLMVGIIYGLVFMAWFFNKSGFMRRMMTKWFLRRILAAVIVAMIPGARFMIPELTILVLLTHYREKKIVRMFNKTVEGTYKFI